MWTRIMCKCSLISSLISGCWYREQTEWQWKFFKKPSSQGRWTGQSLFLNEINGSEKTYKKTQIINYRN